MAAFDWFVRVYTPAFLRLAGLEEHARKLERLRKIADPEQNSINAYAGSRAIRKDMQERGRKLPPWEDRPERGHL